MKIQFDQLAAHLSRHFFPVYLISGEETLFVEEAENLIRSTGLKKGFGERIRFHVDTGFDWSVFQTACYNTSLFSEQQCLELHLNSGKISEAGKVILLNYLQKPSSNKVLIIRVGKLDAALQKTAWIKEAEKTGVVISIWPLSSHQFLPWIERRLKEKGFQTTQAGLELLALRTQGNLLATAQEIEKLSLLYPAGYLNPEQLEESSTHNARYTVFQLADELLENQPLVMMRILKSLKGEGIEPVLVIWALAREIRKWIYWKEKGGFSMEKRKSAIEGVLRKHTIESLYQCLEQAAEIDQMIKGVIKGSVWEALERLVLLMSHSLYKTCR